METKTTVKFQHYASSRIAMNLVTEAGTKVRFVNHQYITADDEIIAYLDDQIKRGLNVITKGELLTAEDAEYLEKEAAELVAAAKGETRDMGETASKPDISPASSKSVVGGAGNKAPSARQ